ncbi:protein SEED AND ROOT HAIR PROTECTIVE PROTEIN-like [Humulus lupulus]|uniref:protein SEED AND ROOT HAIR PROTECTIVE PROTEIN-like n=1 Tax=Humulus lupulus TaxID=3486 RepID=UPI002B412174|nr:protein SEED AND ROOT HAIR PROTECTIVE PROTEIN-like [Humulus lupulus]
MGLMMNLIFPLFLSSFLIIIASATYYPNVDNNNNNNHDDDQSATVFKSPHHHVNYLNFDHLFDHLKPQGTQKVVDPIVGGVIPPIIHTIGIQGVILCQTAHHDTYLPIQGAVARVTCCPNYSSSSYENENENGEKYYKDVPSSILSYESDTHGFFLVKLSVSQLTTGLNVKEDCKVFLEYSPLQTCNLPTDLNNGVTGANLSFLNAYKGMVFYALGGGPLIYTSKTNYNSDHQYSAPTPRY